MLPAHLPLYFPSQPIPGRLLMVRNEVIHLHQDWQEWFTYIFYEELWMTSTCHTFLLPLDSNNEGITHASRQLLAHRHIYWTLTTVYYLSSVAYLFSEEQSCNDGRLGSRSSVLQTCGTGWGWGVCPGRPRTWSSRTSIPHRLILLANSPLDRHHAYPITNWEPY